MNTKLRRRVLISIITPALLMFGFLVLNKTNIVTTETASAAVTSGSWRAGQIIDDSVFYNSDDMTVDQIQAFLESKNPVCDTWGVQRSELGGGTRAQYGASRGYPAPFTCLKDYYENPFTHVNNLSGRPIPAGGMNAAQLIKNAAQTYGISVRALLVLIQKESPGPLITDSWPFPNQYRNAMGYGCPDTAPCDPQYEGFYNQVSNAARQFVIYKNNPNSYRHKSGQTNSVLYNPQAVCGSSNVYIDGKATAGLYNYTPYQPNQAALNNMYGTGDACSAYGNRNFWRMFNDWFGSTLGLSRDAAITASSGTEGWLEYGESRTVSVTVKNTGNDGWCADGSCPAGQLPTRLVSQNYAAFGLHDASDSAWVNSSQIKMQTPSVLPGESGVFTFKVKAPYAATSVSSRFYAVIGGVNGTTTFAQNGSLWIGGHSYAPAAPTLVSQSQQSQTAVRSGEKITATVTLRNNSKEIWYSDANLTSGRVPTRLVAPGYSPSSYYDKQDSKWLTSSQIAMTTPVVNPGENAVFTFSLQGGYQESSAPLRLIPVIDGRTALQDIGISLKISTPAPTLNYEYVSASFPPAQTTVNSTSTQKATITIKNTSNTVWRSDASGSSNPTRIVTILPSYRSSAFYSSATNSGWLAPSQIAMKTAVVAPGEYGVFEFDWKAPATAGNYLEYFSLVTDGYKFFPLYGSAWRTIVTN